MDKEKLIGKYEKIMDILNPLIVSDKLKQIKEEFDNMEEEKWIECEYCNGEGEVYVDTSGSCWTVANECCGGCGYSDTCPECLGEKEILIED
tara:strand:+ start:56 stop:331 length:276 start_codon:yes stop_codon:yes gene_type:complete